MTAEEMKQLNEEINDLLKRYAKRASDKSSRPADAEPVHVVAFGHPLPPMPSGH